MAQTQEPRIGEKRGPGRPPKTATPAAKRLKTTAAPTPPSLLATPVPQSPAVDSPVPEKRVLKLPLKVTDNKPLPSISEPQPLDLSLDEYQSIAASAVLQASLSRSRSKWVCDGLFQRYWTKPEGGKNAKPPPPNNPEVKFMKSKGECRIRLEPHLLVADVFVEEKPRPKQVPQNPGGYGPQYRPPQPFQNRPVQPSPSLQPARAPQVVAPASTPLQDKKASPDPVISMLASRASSDPELKALMKEVATGNATQDQLKVFQRHIDELTAIILKQKKDEEEQVLKAQQASSAIRHDTADTKTQPPVPSAPQRTPYPAQQPPVPVYAQQPIWTPPAHLPVLLEFKTVGATEDRFLFPQYSILESLSPQHELVSFIVTRKGREAADTTGLELNKEYWQPVTMMVEVAYGREGILKNIRDWVKPADQVRKHMEDIIGRCQRAPATFLALRLPIKGSATVEIEQISKDSTPISDAVEKPKTKPAKKSTLPKSADSPLPPPAKVTPGATTGPESSLAASTATGVDAASAVSGEQATPSAVGTGDLSTTEAGENERPRRATRAVRKSVRISEG